MKIEGDCHCGNLTYEADIDVEQVDICHCTDCQTLSASAFRVTVSVPEERFRLLTGTPKIYTKTAESGVRRWQVFCPECGTQIYAIAAEGEPKVFSVRVGTARQRNQLAPKRQYWCRSALAWIDDIGSLQKFDME